MKTVLIVAVTVGVTISAVVGYSYLVSNGAISSVVASKSQPRPPNVDSYLVSNGAISSVAPSFLEQLCLACEKKLKDRLKSPSSYVRLDCTGPITKIPTLKELKQFQEELIHSNWKWNLSSSGRSTGYQLFAEQAIAAERIEQIRKETGNQNLRISEAILEYEAINSYGASIRNFKSCEAVHYHNDSYLGRLLGESAVKIGEYDR